jgi:hypothetical protein
LSGLTGGGWPLLVGWIFPSGITVSLFAFVVFPRLEHLPVAKDVAALSGANQGLLLAFSAVLLGVLLSALQTPLYRVLEGYYLPERLRDRWIERQLQRKRTIQEELKAKRKARAALQGAGSPPGAGTHDGQQPFKEVNTDLLLEKLHRYPVDDRQVAPTQLANGIRAFESYGYDRFWLDSQALWTELLSAVSETVRTEQSHARAAVDFFVSLVYLFALLGCVVLVTALFGDQARVELLVMGVICVLLVPAWYRGAVVTTANWRSSVQALVNVGRKPLAEALGLELPQDLAREREMWRTVGWLVKYRYNEQLVPLLQPYRRAPSRDGKATEAAADGAAGAPQQPRPHRPEGAGMSGTTD